MPNALRLTMLDLIEEVRGLIHDKDATTFTDLEIQNQLDRNRDDWRYIEITPVETRDSVGIITWLNYYPTSTWLGSGTVGDWEADATIYGNDGSGHSFALLTPFLASVDFLVGHWVLSQSIRPPVFILGKTYDVCMAASGLLSTQASSEMLEFAATQMGTSAMRNQKYEMLIKQSREMSNRRRPTAMRMARPDVRPETSGPFHI